MVSYPKRTLVMRTKDRSIEIEQDKDLSTLGGRLQYARRLSSMTQEELGMAIDQTRSSIAQYEGDHATPPLEVICRLAASVCVDPRFLIFGDEPGQTENLFAGGRLVPVGEAIGDAAYSQPIIGLPSILVSDFTAKAKELKFLLLEVPAPHFGLRQGCYLLLETGLEKIEADGQIYAVRSTAGLALVRSEPQFDMTLANVLQFTDGNGQGRTVEESALALAGRLVATLQAQGAACVVKKGQDAPFRSRRKHSAR